MHLMRFRAETVAGALESARAALGPDAVVLSTTMVGAGGLRGLFGARQVEVTAAAERQVSETRPARTVDRHAATRAAVASRLIAAGFDRRLAEEVAANIDPVQARANAPARIAEALAQTVSGIACADQAPARIQAFVGPPGAGKTTTIAKLAAQARATRGPRFTLVAADGFRVGAIEQLRFYADIVGAPFAVARTPRELEDTLAQVTGPALVDTAGRSPSDPPAVAFFEALQRISGVQTHLVVPADTTPRALARILETHAAAQPRRIVLSKADEAETPGVIAHVLRDSQLPISYIGTGQSIPGDLVRATAPVLSALLLGEPVMRAEVRA